MILIFDLDDTLYDEVTYIKSGYLKVSEYLSLQLGLSKKLINSKLNTILKRSGRKKVFSKYLKNKKLIQRSIKIYRNHNPQIKIYKEANRKLKFLDKRYTMYLLTNGYKESQEKKIKALKIKNFFKKIYITHKFGLKNMKPSLYCFKKIKKIEKCNWEEMCYIGDDPKQDFINLNKVGAKTVRIRKGQNFNIKLKYPYEAKKTINSITKLNIKFLKKLSNEHNSNH